MKRTQNLALLRWGALPSTRARFFLRSAAFLASLGCLALTAPAVAQLDTDPVNNAQATADPLPLAAPGTAFANRAMLALPGNDVDFFGVTLLADEVLLGIATPIENLPLGFDAPDTLASVFDGGVMRTFSDDDGANDPTPAPIRGSLFRVRAIRSGVHHIGVTGYYDAEFDGAASGDTHGETGLYWLTVGRVNPSIPGGGFLDTDPANQTTAGANAIVLGPGTNAAVAVSRLAAGGDVDFYRLSLQAGDVLSAMTAPLGSLPTDYSAPDTMLGLFDSSGGLLFFDDDSGDRRNDPAGVLASDSPFVNADANDVFGSALRAEISASGTYYLGVTGFGDDTFVGAHGESGAYALLVGVPEPASMVLFAAGLAALLAAASRRRWRS